MVLHRAFKKRNLFDLEYLKNLEGGHLPPGLNRVKVIYKVSLLQKVWMENCLHQIHTLDVVM